MRGGRSPVTRIVNWRRVLAVLVIAAVQAALALWSFALAFWIGDSGGQAPPWLTAALWVLGTPGFLLIGPRTEALFGDPAEFYLAAAAGGLAWGGAIVCLTVWVRGRWRRRARVVT